MTSFDSLQAPWRGVGSSARRRARRFVALVAALASSAAVVAQTKSDPDYIAGLAAWQQARYPVASEHLSRYRVSVPYGKSYDVDYLLGTAWCRMPGLQAKGAGLLSWALQHDMPESAAGPFRAEWQLCRAVAVQEAVKSAPVLLASANVNAGASARASGKMYYAVGGEGSPLSAYPLELVKPLPEAEYASRIFPLDATAQAVQATRARLDGGFTVVASGRFILASKGHSEAELKAIGVKLEGFVAFLRNEYQIEFPQRYVTVYLHQDARSLVVMAMAVHGLRASEMSLGYTFQNDLSVVGFVQGEYLGTLLHELFHLGVRANFGDIPSWLDESIASVYETSVQRDGRYVGVSNWRAEVIRRAGMGTRFTLRDMVAYLSSDQVTEDRARPPEYRSDEAAYMAALGRYFALYLQDQGKLRAVYLAFRDRPKWTVTVPAQQASVRLIEEAAASPAVDLERAYVAWLRQSLAVREPAAPTQPSSSTSRNPPLNAPMDAPTNAPIHAVPLPPCDPRQQMQQQACNPQQP